MRYLPVNKLRPGMVIAKGILDSKNNVLLNEGVRLTNDYIKRIETRGIIGAYIFDELTKGIIVQAVISNELRGKAIKSIREFDIESTINVSKSIVDQLLSDDNMVMDLVDLRTFDDYTFRHSVNVAILSTIIAIGLNFKYDELAEICMSALLHDIGKLEIPAEILNKPDKLTDEEYEIIKGHPSIAYNLVKDRWDISATTKIGMLLHHENVDGSGYPYGLKGPKIHRYARIIHVADVYDALSSNRPYKKAYSPADSIEFIMGSCGTLFDRDIVEIFMGYVPLYPKGATVLLSNGKKAIVAENFKFNTMRPKVILEESGNELDLAYDPDCRSITIIGLDEE